MDDVAIGTDDSSRGRELHQQIIHNFLNILEQHSYFLKVSKCEFEKPQIEFLGFLVEKGTTRVDPSKIGGISDWPRELASVKQVRQILGVLGYQRCEELTTSSFRGQTREAQGNVKRNRRGRRGGARRIYPREYRRRRGRGCRSECRVDLHLKGTTKEMDEVGSEDEGDDYQGGIDDDEDGKSNGIQVRGTDLVECTSGQSEDYPSHWGVYILNTVFVLLWSNGPCKLRSMVHAQ